MRLLEILRANSFSSSVKKFAPAMLSGRKKAAIKLATTVARPSRMKIHRQPARLPIPSMLRMAVARRPVVRRSRE
jgi:hypothetical protein